MKDVSIITGASKGIGRGIALRLAKEGHDVVLFGRNIEDLLTVELEAKESGADTLAFSGDVADIEFVNNSIKLVYEKFGKIDHLINNAGIGILKKLVESNIDEFKKQMDTNVFGVYNFIMAVVNDMILRKSGSIINIASLAGKNSFVGGTMYSSTKHALLGLTRSLMLELREYNIRVTSVCPGSVNTSLLTDTILNPTDKSRILQVEDVAECIVTILKLPPRALISEIDLRPTNPK